LSKVNPGSNFNEDNDVRTASPGMQDIDIAEPIMGEKGKLQCPNCERQFESREDYISHALSKHQMSKPSIMQPLDIVPYSNGFHFFVDIGRYTGETAVSLVTFAKEIEVVPIESIDFHFRRADFQKWIADTIGDSKLATLIENIDKGLTGEPLRKELLLNLNARIKELRGQT